MVVGRWNQRLRVKVTLGQIRGSPPKAQLTAQDRRSVEYVNNKIINLSCRPEPQTRVRYTFDFLTPLNESRKPYSVGHGNLQFETLGTS